MLAEPLIGIALFGLVLAFTIDQMVRYAPGEKRKLELERRARTHTRSHDYKLPRKTR